MSTRFNPQPAELERLEVGLIGQHLRGFAPLIVKQNYSSTTQGQKETVDSRYALTSDGGIALTA